MVVELVFYQRMLAKLIELDGWLVPSSACGQVEIAHARNEGRFFVDQNSIGYVVRPNASRPVSPELRKGGL